MANLAKAYTGAGKLDQALSLAEETLKLMKANLGLEHPNTLSTMAILAGVYQKAGKLDQALPLAEETFRLMKAKLGPMLAPSPPAVRARAGRLCCAVKADRRCRGAEEGGGVTQSAGGPQDWRRARRGRRGSGAQRPKEP